MHFFSFSLHPCCVFVMNSIKVTKNAEKAGNEKSRKKVIKSFTFCHSTQKT